MPKYCSPWKNCFACLSCTDWLHQFISIVSVNSPTTKWIRVTNRFTNLCNHTDFNTSGNKSPNAFGCLPTESTPLSMRGGCTITYSYIEGVLGTDRVHPKWKGCYNNGFKYYCWIQLLLLDWEQTMMVALFLLPCSFELQMFYEKKKN